MDFVSKETSSKLSGNKLVGLHIDESGNRKKGSIPLVLPHNTVAMLEK
jgi:hypothetical protein